MEGWLELWNTGDLSLAEDVFAIDFVSHIPRLRDVTDLESYKGEVTKTGSDVPDFHATFEDMVAEGNKVAGRFTVTGTMQPAGVQYTNTSITIFRFAGGKMVETWWTKDTLGLM